MIQTLQMTAATSPKCLDPNRGYNVGMIKLMASAAGAFFGGAGVTTSGGAAVPTAQYVDLPGTDPSSVFVVGSGTVYIVLVDQPGGGT